MKINELKRQHSLVTSENEEGVDALTLAEIASVELRINADKMSYNAASIVEQLSNLKRMLLAPRSNKGSLPPNFRGRIGQRGYAMVIHEYSFNGIVAGHEFCEGEYYGGLPQRMTFSDGEYVDFQIGAACGILWEKWYRWHYGGHAPEIGINRIPIKVPGLVYIGEAPTHHLIGDGADGSHFDTHYVKPDVKNSLHSLSKAYHKKTGNRLFYNDASLPWGGLLDINTNYKPPHHEHRDGREIDIAATPTTLPPDSESIFLEELKKITGNYILEGSGRSRHYHVRF